MYVDIELRCNQVTCRKGLQHEEKVCVTSCSHVFCVECANKAFGHSFICPACETHLNNEVDIAVCIVSPKEEWKSMVLAGLRPEIVMEICSRALSFWTYQIFHERYLTEMLRKQSERERQESEKRFEHALMEMNSQLTSLQTKYQDQTKERSNDMKKQHEISDKYAEKCRQFQRLQIMYDELRRKAMQVGLNANTSPIVAPPTIQSNQQGNTIVFGSNTPWSANSTPTASRQQGNYFNSQISRSKTFDSLSAYAPHEGKPILSETQSVRSYSQRGSRRTSSKAGSVDIPQASKNTYLTNTSKKRTRIPLEEIKTPLKPLDHNTPENASKTRNRLVNENRASSFGPVQTMLTNFPSHTSPRADSIVRNQTMSWSATNKQIF